MTVTGSVDNFSVSMREMVVCLSRSIDLVTSSVKDHHRIVAFIAGAISSEMNLSAEERKSIILAAALHDIGALSTKERLSTLDFEYATPHRHADIGYLLLRNLDDLAREALIVKYHHVPWENGKGAAYKGLNVPLGSQILFAADRAAVLIDPRREILGQQQTILSAMRKNQGSLFRPDVIDALIAAAQKEAFWLDIGFLSMEEILDEGLGDQSLNLSLEGLLSLAGLFREIIDFRTDFTAAHSTGVAVVAETLSSLSGFSRDDVRKMRVAGLLHDLGKLSVPTEMLEKKSGLSQSELYFIRQHPYYTYRLLEPMKALSDLRIWASLHHERLNGTGYPFRLTGDKIPPGARILAVADIFTALAEERPYRGKMQKLEILSILGKAASGGELDASVIETLRENFELVDETRAREQAPVFKEYRRILGNSPALETMQETSV